MDDVAFVKWTLETARKGGAAMAWFEERGLDWCEIALKFVNSIIEGRTIVLCVDLGREWFGSYALTALNATPNRPLIPIVQLRSMLPSGFEMQRIEEIEDMLAIAFGERYSLWCVGSKHYAPLKLALRRENSLVWAFDGDFSAAFNLSLNEPPARLLQLFDLLDKSLSAVMFGEI